MFKFKKIWRLITVAALLAGALNLSLLPATPAQAVSSGIVISQIYGGGGNLLATYKNDYIELFNLGSSPVSLNGWSVQYASAAGTTWAVTNLTNVSLAPGQYYLVQEASVGAVGANLPSPDATGTINMSATNGKVALVSSTTALTGSCPTGGSIVDFIGFGTANCFETTAAPAASNTIADIRALSGCTETDNNSTDFATGTPLPRNTSSPTNSCEAPRVSSVVPANNAVNVAANADITVTFSEAVTLTDPWFTLTCTTSGVKTAVVTGGPTIYTINPDVDFSAAETCTLTVTAANVSDVDTNDPPDTMAADFTSNFSVFDPAVCGQSFMPIYDIQGSGNIAAITGVVTTKGIVVSDEEGASPALGGFYLQDVTGDANPATSDGIFVNNGSNNNVSNGDIVRVTGTAGENQGQTQISTVTSIAGCGTGTLAPIDISLPFASVADQERYEGMLVRVPQTLTVTEMYLLGRFGQVTMGGTGKLYQPTNIVAPGAPAIAMQAANDLNKIILDDASQFQNPDPILFGRGGNPLSASNTLRGGDTLTGLVGVFTYTWGGNSSSPNAYRIRPINAMGGGIPNFATVNARPTTAPVVGGTIKVVGMNLLNYFNTFADSNPGTPGCFPGGGDSDCRGANNATEFTRQSTKAVNAILAMDADVIGIAEMENDGYDSSSAIQDLVNKLNAIAGAGTYAFINPDATLGVNSLGLDAIKVGLLYQPAKVIPLGTTATLNTVAFVNGGDGAPRNRASLLQAFQSTTSGETFLINVNHLKSKGSCPTAGTNPGNEETGDGQSCWNLVRTNAVNALLTWFGTNPTGTGDPDLLIVGDLNSYAKEDPIAAFETAGYTNMAAHFDGASAYSYVFDGQWGYLDYGIASPSLLAQTAGFADWHINSDEPSVLDYNVEFKTAGQITNLYSSDPFRTSDHDPVLVGLNLDVVGPTIVSNTRANPDNTSATSVDFTVTFSESVTGVSVGDFTLTTSGVSGASVSGFIILGNVYTVTVNTGNGSGTIRLDVPASATITDLAGNPLANLPYITGDVYTVTKVYNLFLPLIMRQP